MKPMKPAGDDEVVHHDRRLDPERPWVTVAHDLNLLPWPWAESSFDVIVATAVLEHLNIDLVESLDECWRILRVGGHAAVKVPMWDSELAHVDPTHRWFLTPATFDYFDPERRRGREYGFYTERKWKIVKGPMLNRARSSIHVVMQVRK